MNGQRTASLRRITETLRGDGPVALWTRMRMKEQDDYEEWLEERDIVRVIAALRRLSERELGRIGLSHTTLALDVGDLVCRAAREREIGREVLELVEDDSRMMAAE